MIKKIKMPKLLKGEAKERQQTDMKKRKPKGARKILMSQIERTKSPFVMKKVVLS